MKKLLKINIVGAVLLTITSMVILPTASSEASLKETSVSVLEAKKCEKCKRGDDGKMVCEPVPCP